MAKVSLKRGSWLRRASFEEVEYRGKFYSYFELPDYPEIPDQDDDILHVIRNGERPDQLAYRYYGDQRLWWVIAVKNDWDQPLTSLVQGEEITVPSPRYIRESLVR